MVKIGLKIFLTEQFRIIIYEKTQEYVLKCHLNKSVVLCKVMNSNADLSDYSGPFIYKRCILFTKDFLRM